MVTPLREEVAQLARIALRATLRRGLLVTAILVPINIGAVLIFRSQMTDPGLAFLACASAVQYVLVTAGLL